MKILTIISSSTILFSHILKILFLRSVFAQMQPQFYSNFTHSSEILFLTWFSVKMSHILI